VKENYQLKKCGEGSSHIMFFLALHNICKGHDIFFTVCFKREFVNNPFTIGMNVKWRMRVLLETKFTFNSKPVKRFEQLKSSKQN
jgi:uncharacterized protein (DUF1919 family)